MSAYVRGQASAAIAARKRAVAAQAELGFSFEHPAVTARRGNTEGVCGRGCCWTPFAVCAVENMCNCHYAPAPESTEYDEYDEALDNAVDGADEDLDKIIEFPGVPGTRTEDGHAWKRAA